MSAGGGKAQPGGEGGHGEEGEWRAGDKGRRGYRAGEQQPDKPEGGWLVCGHPFRGVDIVGPKISLNSGGSPGTPGAGAATDGAEDTGDEKSGDGSDSEKKMKTLEGTA
nr:hypothetical protein [Escherichia coli]